AFDPCVYSSKSKQSFVVVYVDDITVVGTKCAIDMLVSGLKREFSVSVKCPLSWILGIKVQQTPDSLYMTVTVRGTRRDWRRNSRERRQDWARRGRDCDLTSTWT